MDNEELIDTFIKELEILGFDGGYYENDHYQKMFHDLTKCYNSKTFAHFILKLQKLNWSLSKEDKELLRKAYFKIQLINLDEICIE